MAVCWYNTNEPLFSCKNSGSPKRQPFIIDCRIQKMEVFPMSIIIGIDHGYYAIKTAHCSFPAGLRSPCRPNHWRGQFPHWHRHCLCRGHTHPCRRRWHRHCCQQSWQLGRQLRLLHPNRPRRRTGNTICTLLQHLCHHRPTSAGRAGHRLCRPHWASHRQPFALRGTCKRKQDRRNEVFRNVNCKEKHVDFWTSVHAAVESPDWYATMPW